MCVAIDSFSACRSEALSLAFNAEPLTVSLALNPEPLTLSWGCILYRTSNLVFRDVFSFSDLFKTHFSEFSCFFVIPLLFDMNLLQNLFNIMAFDSWTD